MFQSVTASGAGGSVNVILSWSTLPGQIYRLQYNDDLTAATWITVVPDIIATGATVIVTNIPSSSMHRFYRVHRCGAHQSNDR